MSSESSQVKTENRTTARSRRSAARQATLRRFQIESLEPRTLMAVLPATVFNQTNTNANTFSNAVSPYQTTGASNIASDGNKTNDSSPSIAVDPADPSKLVATWTATNPSLPNGRIQYVEYAYSVDAGKTWSNPQTPQSQGPGRSGNLTDPTSSSTSPISYILSSDSSVAFNSSGNFYILWDEHNGGTTSTAAGTSGALRIEEFDFGGSTPAVDASFANGPTTVYQWDGESAALTPVLAVDASMSSFTDTNSTGTVVKQVDPNAGNVYVAWQSIDQAPTNAQNFNPDRILFTASQDGGLTFMTPVSLDPNGSFGPQRDGTPQITISQGSAPRAAGTNGPNDPGSPGVAGGQVSVVWDDWGSDSQANPPLDRIMFNSIAGGLSIQNFSAAPTTVNAAVQIPNGPLIPTINSITIPVNITDPKFTTLQDLSLTVALNADMSNLQMVLIPPQGSGLQPITLANKGQLSGVLGTATGGGVGTTFDDNAVRSIFDKAVSSPYIGTFRAGTSIDNLYGGLSPSQLNGPWTLQITSYATGDGGPLSKASLNFTSNVNVGNSTVIATTPVRASESGAPTATNVDAQGIAPAPVIASDNTLGAYSPYQGRLYVAYVGRYENQNTPADNTDIFLVASDDGGQTWTIPNQASSRTTGIFGFQGGVDFGEVVNDDNTVADGYSEGINGTPALDPASASNNGSGFNGQSDTLNNGGVPGRAQFQPSIAVDPATGTVGLSWYDARNDASRNRVATYTTTSIDGANSFSPNVYANNSQIATDAITGNIVNLGPIPANESAPSAAGVETAVGYGYHQGLAMYGGQLYPIWSDDQNGGTGNAETLGTFTNVGYYAAGPRVISATQGPIGLPGDTVNYATAPDGTPVANAFQVTFDRPIDAASFNTGDVVVMYHDTTQANLTGGAVPVTSVVPLNSGPFGSTKFQINFAPRTGTGTYSLEVRNPTVNGFVQNDIHDRIRTMATTTAPDGAPVTLDAATTSGTTPALPVTVAPGSYNYVAIPASQLPANDLLSNVSVTVNVGTTSDSSVIVYLFAPDGNLYTLVRQREVQGSGGFVNTTFSSAAGAVPLSSGNPTNNFASPPSYLPVTSLAKLDGTTIPAGSFWYLEVFNGQASKTATIRDFSVTYQPARTALGAIPGNPLDQNVAGLSQATFQPTPAQIAAGLSSSVTWPGAAADFFETPMPVTGQFVPILDQTGQNVAALPVPGTTPFAGPYNANTLPLILTGPRVVSSSVPGAASGAAAQNLVVNGTVSAIDVTFDRNINPATISAASVLQVIGPAGKISGPFTLTQPNPNDARTFQIGFPKQTLSGVYTVTLASNIADTFGNQLDTNMNAGIDVLAGSSSTLNQTRSIVYTAPAQLSTGPFGPPAANVPLPITDGSTTVSSLNVPDVFQATELSVQLNITEPNDPDLQISLLSPNNVSIPLVPFGTGKTGTHANFSNTVFADATNQAFSSGTPLSNGSAPFFGTFAPAQSIINALLPANGANQAVSFQAAGTWKLVIVDNSGTGTHPAGTLNSWSLTFQKPVTISDLGQQVADQATVSFRIFNMDPTNAQSSTTWTAVGPAGVTDPTNPSTAGTNGFAGQVSSTVVDPSDPSGNTVFATGASGGVWKTTNFLTTDPNGPTWVPLTDFGPTSSMNIGSIAVFPRNNDPRQSIVIAGTGDGSTANNRPGSGTTVGGNTYQGVGFIISKDGGATWQLLDSTNNNLPYAQRDHLFAQVGAGYNGTATMKIAVDPHLTPSGGVIFYAAMMGVNGGLWKSSDTGQTWILISGAAMGAASDVLIDTTSATKNALGQPTGNANIIYAAFPGSGVYISANQGSSFNLMAGGTVDPLLSNQGPGIIKGVPVTNGNVAPVSVANGGRIVLARPAPVPPSNPNYQILNTLYEGWLYAVATTPSGGLDGVYLTKDQGTTWTKLQINGLAASANSYPVPALPTNDSTDNISSPYNVLSSNLFQHGDYNLAVAVDPNNPNIVYLGGTANGNSSGFIRINATNVNDSHALVPYSYSKNDGGSSSYNTNDGAVVEQNVKDGLARYLGTSSVASNFNEPAPYINLTVDPNNPFATNSTLFTYNVANFSNDGSGVTWTPVDAMLYANASSTVPSSNIHNITTFVDPLTGDTRLIVSDDQGVFTGEFSPNGALMTSVGTDVVPAYSRNGNLQLAQLFYGASEPSVTLANGTTTPLNLFLGNGQNVGQVGSDPNILSNGNTAYTGSLNGANAGFFAQSSADQGGVGIGVDQQGNGVLYRYLEPAYGGNGSDFFQVSIDGGQTWVSRTVGLEQTAQDPQWPGESPVYPNGVNVVTGLANPGNAAIKFGNFAVNPIDSNEVIIGSATGRVFATSNQGEFWNSIGEPSSFVLNAGGTDTSYKDALAFGAPDPSAPGGVGGLNNFLYAGSVNGNIFVSTTGGGAIGSGNWTDISAGLDGSPVVKIITDPTRGSHDAYAVTQAGVYYMPDSVPSATNTPTWVNITGNLFALTRTSFGATTAAVNFLTSIQADWRYAIPNATTTTGTGTGTGTTANAGPSTHPILYVSGDGGVFESTDQGTTWTFFPSQVGGAPVDGGYLPSAQVTDLTTALGKIDPTTGFPVSQAGDPNVLLATTFGRGQFAIKLSPQVLPTSVALSATQPTSSGSTGSQSGTDANGLPLVRISQPVFTGISEQSAFGNTVYITLYDITDPSNPVYIGGFNPALDPTPGNAAGNPTAIPANETDSAGNFAVQVSPTGFTANGVHTIGVQATDQSGATGNVAGEQIDLLAHLTSLSAPATPTLALAKSSNTTAGTMGGVYTNVSAPVVTGTTDPGVPVVITGTGVITSTKATVTIGPISVTSDSDGNYQAQLPALQDGTYTLQATATNPSNSSLKSTGQPYTFNVLTTPPQTPTTLQLAPSSDTGVVGDNITTDHRPVFTGTTVPNGIVSLYVSKNGVPVQLTGQTGPLGQGQADASGHYSIQLANAESNGTITLQLTVTDAAMNAGPYSNPLTVTFATATADYTGTGKTTPALVSRNADGTLSFIIQGVTGASGSVFGNAQATGDIPIVGDFDGDGITDRALYRPSAGAFFIARTSRPGETIVFPPQDYTPNSLPVVGDFDGDGTSDVGLYDPMSGTWSLDESSAGMKQVRFNTNVFSPQAGDVPVPGDYNGTGLSELAIYRPGTGQFFIQAPGKLANGMDNIQVVTVSTGSPGDVPVPGNYNNTATSHMTEPAVFNPNTGKWQVAGQVLQQFNPGDIPAPGDYDATGKDELAVYRPSINSFVVDGPSGQRTIPLGAKGDIPVTSPLYYREVISATPTLTLSNAPLSGSNITSARHPIFSGTTSPGAIIDLLNANGQVINGAVADSNGNFAIGDGTTLANGVYTYQVRAHTAVNTIGPVSPLVTVHVATVAGDYTGVGYTQPALVIRGANNSLVYYVQGGGKNLNGKPLSTGAASVPLVGDFLGKGTDQIAAFTPSTGNWTIEQAGSTTPQVIAKNFGTGPNYIPVPGNYAGNGVDVPAVYETTTGKWFIAGQATIPPIITMKPGDIPVPGNWDNTGKTEPAIYRPSNQTYYILGRSGFYPVTFGGVGDVPVPGQYNSTQGNQATYPADWVPGAGLFRVRTPGGGTQVFQFKPGDIPAPGDYDQVGMTEPAVYRPSTGQFIVFAPGASVPHVVTTQAFGGANFIPLMSPYQYRAVAAASTAVKAAVATTSVVATPATPARTAATSTATTPAPVTVAIAKSRPVQSATMTASKAAPMSLLKMVASAKKGA